ncbi:MAG TPA: PEGA domain-containing protein, partial [Kofleriaceae bacterium]|nr:PEGA domain-containing protein [Kofleriaceae bacterium]
LDGSRQGCVPSMPVELRIGGAGGLAVIVAVVGLSPARALAQQAAPPPASVHVQLYATEGLSEPERRRLETEIANAVRAALPGSRVRTGYPGQKTAGDAGVVGKALERSDQGLLEGKRRVENLEEGALDLLDWAAEEYSRYLPQLIARDGNAERLMQVFIQMTIVHFLNEEMEAAADALRRALVLNPELDYSRSLFPPQLEQFVVQERLLFDELGTGSMKVSAEGGDITVFINGIERGKAPLEVQDLRAGPNIVTLVADGVEPVVASGLVDSGHVAKVEASVKLPPSTDGGPLGGTRGDVGAPTASQQMSRAGKELGVQGLVLVTPNASGTRLELVASIYDLRSGDLVGRGDLETDREHPGPEADEMVRGLVANTRWTAAVDLAVQPPIWKHKYFWPTVGVAAGIVLVAVVVGATSGLSNSQKIGLFPISRF